MKENRQTQTEALKEALKEKEQEKNLLKEETESFVEKTERTMFRKKKYKRKEIQIKREKFQKR